VLKLNDENERVSVDIAGACNPGASNAEGDTGGEFELIVSPSPGGDDSGEEYNWLGDRGGEIGVGSWTCGESRLLNEAGERGE
jgi:hypothetical protein